MRVILWKQKVCGFEASHGFLSEHSVPHEMSLSLSSRPHFHTHTHPYIAHSSLMRRRCVYIYIYYIFIYLSKYLFLYSNYLFIYLCVYSFIYSTHLWYIMIYPITNTLFSRYSHAPVTSLWVANTLPAGAVASEHPNFLCVSINEGTLKWLVFVRENPMKIDDLGVSPFQKTSLWRWP